MMFCLFFFDPGVRMVDFVFLKGYNRFVNKLIIMGESNGRY